jgi:hypothetical protein
MFPGGGFFVGAPLIFILFFIIVLGFIVFRMIGGIRQWHSNNQQPVLTVPAQIVSKRTNVDHHDHNNGGNISHNTTTHYYVTFEVESGDRMELLVDGHDYGLLAEDDFGKLTFQGTRFKGFEREKQTMV